MENKLLNNLILLIKILLIFYVSSLVLFYPHKLGIKLNRDIRIMAMILLSGEGGRVGDRGQGRRGGERRGEGEEA